MSREGGRCDGEGCLAQEGTLGGWAEGREEGQRLEHHLEVGAVVYLALCGCWWC